MQRNVDGGIYDTDTRMVILDEPSCWALLEGQELGRLAVSIANACSYCVHSHTAAARAKGMTDAQHAELLAIVSLAARTNHLANGLQVSLDRAFDAAASPPG